MDPVTRTVGFIRRPTIDLRTVLGVIIDKPRYPVYSGWEGEMEAIGSARVYIDGDRVVADITLVGDEPDGSPTIAFKDGEICTVPFRDKIAAFFRLKRPAKTAIVGVLGHIFYDMNPAWPELKR